MVSPEERGTQKEKSIGAGVVKKMDVRGGGVSGEKKRRQEGIRGREGAGMWEKMCEPDKGYKKPHTPCKALKRSKRQQRGKGDRLQERGVQH